MPVTQRFYPIFFLNALRNDGVLADGGISTCQIALFNENAAFNVEHDTTSDVSSNMLVGSQKSLNVNVYRNGSVLYFEVPEVSWSSLPNEQFQHVIISKSVDKIGNLLLMHLDLGSLQLPINGEFTLTPDSNCIPNIDFSYEVCI